MQQKLVTWYRSCCFSGEDAPGNDVALDRLTLRFPTSAEELGFLHQYNARLTKIWPVAVLFYVLYLLVWTVCSLVYVASTFPESGVDDARIQVEVGLSCLRIGSIILVVLHVICCKTSLMSKRIGYISRENAVIVLIIYSSIASFFSHRHYIAKLLGHSNHHAFFGNGDLPAPYSDTPSCLSLMMVLVASHCFLPLRWCKLCAVQLTVPLCYAAAWAWSPETNKLTVLVHMMILTCVSGFGKRQLEVNERLAFSSLMSEKTLRMQEKTLRLQLEFELSQSAHSQHADEEVSIPETTCTGAIFNDLKSRDSDISDLKALQSVGKREQWLIDEKDVWIDHSACLGMGGFGMVFAGEYNHSPVALKFHKQAGFCKDLYHLGNELRLLRKLRHPNIVLLQGACLSLQQCDLVLVIERVCGQSYGEFITSQPSEHHLCQALAGICHGLMYLHSRKPVIVHGDLKAQNVMIEQRGVHIHAKMLDFGLARLVTCNARPGGGTYRWLAPEVLAKKRRPSASTDVYAVGLIMFFTCTGIQPFVNYEQQLLEDRAKGKIKVTLVLNWPPQASGFSSKCKPLVDRAMKKSPSDRPNVHQVLQDILELDSFDTSCSTAPSYYTNSNQAKSLQPIRPVASGLGLQGGFWQSLADARQLVFAKQYAAQYSGMQNWAEQVDFATKVLSQRRLVIAKKEDDGVSRGLVEVVSAKCYSPNEPSLSLMHPHLLPTPETFMMASLMDTLMSWNFAQSTMCCTYHGYVAALERVLVKLQQSPCQCMVQSSCYMEQCALCLAVTQTDKDNRPHCCRTCGCEFVRNSRAHSRNFAAKKTTPLSHFAL